MATLEVQDRLRGAIMAHLLESGVTRQDFSSEEFYGDFEQEMPEFETFDSLFLDMLIWLRDEGFIRYDSLYNGDADDTCVALCAPTARAMASLDEKVPGEATTVREIVNKSDGPSHENYARLGAFFGGLIGGYQGSIG